MSGVILECLGISEGVQRMLEVLRGLRPEKSKCPKATVLLTYWEALGEVSELS